MKTVFMILIVNWVFGALILCIIGIITLVIWLDKHWVMAKSRTKRIYKVHGFWETWETWEYRLQTGWLCFWSNCSHRTSKNSEVYEGWIQQYKMKILQS